MQYEQEGVEITVSIPDYKTLSLDNEMDHRKLHHRRSRRLDSAVKEIQLYIIMRTIGNSGRMLRWFWGYLFHI